LGNFPELEPEIKQEDLVNAAIEILETHDPLEYKTLKQLERLEDEVEEDELQKYRDARLKEMRLAADRPSFGFVLEISKTSYVD
jgi:hypothetical protein